MKKIAISRFGGPEVLELVDAPTPALEPEDVLVKSHAIGVGWPDVYVRTGTYPWQHLFPMPATPGIEQSGTVEAVGGEVTRFRVGQPVYVSAGLLGMTGACYAEAKVVPEDRLVPLPDTVPLDRAPHIGYYAVASIFFDECIRGRDIEWVLVSGASGGMGTAIVQMAKLTGHRVIATVGHEHKRAHALAMGADHVLNYRDDDLRARVAEITGGHGVDYWLESYAGPRFADALYCMAPWGRIELYNNVGGHPPASFFDDWRRNIGKCISIEYFAMHRWEHDVPGRRAQIDRTVAMMASGRLVPPPATVMPMEHVVEAHRLLESGSHAGRIFLRV